MSDCQLSVDRFHQIKHPLIPKVKGNLQAVKRRINYKVLLFTVIGIKFISKKTSPNFGYEYNKNRKRQTKQRMNFCQLISYFLQQSTTNIPSHTVRVWAIQDIHSSHSSTPYKPITRLELMIQTS